MAIHNTYRQTDLEKRLKILRQQVYGKNTTNYKLQATNSITDISYLSHDLTKIVILSSLALGTQMALYFALKNNFIKFPF